MNAEKVEDLLAEALAELKTTRQLALENGALALMAWRIAALEGHPYGPEVPESVNPGDLPRLLGPQLQPRLQALLTPAPATNGEAVDA